jgi:hypothetical protein
MKGCTTQIIQNYSVFSNKTTKIFRIFTILVGHFSYTHSSSLSRDPCVVPADHHNLFIFLD